MKKLLPIILLFIAIQHGSSQCVPDGSITTPGFISPVGDVDCINKGAAYTDVIQFMNFDSVFFGGSTTQLQRLRIDSVNNLPCGINWALNNSNGIYMNSEQGCIQLQGVSSDSIGQYKLDIWASIDLGSGFFGPLQANSFDLLTFYVRLKPAVGICPDVDTLAFQHTSYCNSVYGLGVTASNAPTLCFGGDMTLGVNVTNGSGHYSYAWAPPANLSCTNCQSPTLLASSLGQYNYNVTVYDSISTLQTVYAMAVELDVCEGIDEYLHYNALNIYPNPGNGHYTIDYQLAANEDFTLGVTDIQGQEVKISANNNGSHIELDMAGQAPGVYLLCLQTGYKQFLSKLILK